jgi:hypothetical protein
MGRYLGSWKLEDIIYVPVQTSAATTGAAADADAVPTWRMYEDNTATPVTTGSFSTLNSQTGFYMSAITLAAAIGYEKGKSYSLRVQATVNGIIGADVHNLQIEAEVDANVVSGTVATVTNVTNAVTVGATSHAAIADAVWSETAAGYSTAGSLGFVLQDAQSLNAIVAAVAAAVTAGSIGAVTVGATSQAAIADAVWDEAGSGHVAGGSFGARLNVTVNSMTAGAIGPVTVSSTSQAAIADAIWDEPKAGHTTADTYGEYLDGTLGAIKAKTDLIFAGTGNSIAADIRFVNGTSVTGNGQSGTEWGPGS